MQATNMLAYWNALAHLGPLTLSDFTLILEVFGTPQKAWETPTSAWATAGFSRRLLKALPQRESVMITEAWERLAAHNIGLLLITDADYPPLLGTIPDPPPLLYYHGDVGLLSQPQIAIVGSRAATPYGQRVTKFFVSPLSRAGLIITSGLALGIDGLAHSETLSAQSRTIAVLGSGIDPHSIYPRSHVALAEKIVENKGCLLSEYPPGSPTYKDHFPMRNRIIAGLSLGTLVIEAAARSGTRITAYTALQYNRDVFAVPGDIFLTKCVGTNELIKAGATPVLSAADVLLALKLALPNQPQTLPTSPQEKKILSALSGASLTLEELADICALTTTSLLSLLTQMELSGLIQSIAGRFARTNL